MKDTEIILKALQIANNKGYRIYYADVFENYKVDIGGLYLDNGEEFEDEEIIPIRDILFDPEFAKTIWGERIVCNECGKFEEDCDLHIWEHYKIAWQFHVQQMVIIERPLQYLEKFL